VRLVVQAQTVLVSQEVREHFPARVLAVEAVLGRVTNREGRAAVGALAVVLATDTQTALPAVVVVVLGQLHQGRATLHG